MKDQKVVFSVGGMSPVHVLQAVCIAFCVGGCFLAYKLGTGPTEALAPPTTKLAWAVGLAVSALVAPVLSWYYGRSIAARIMVSEDGRAAYIKDANLWGASVDRWPAEALRVTGYEPGDVRGEEAGSPPRMKLVASDGDHSREYVVPLRAKRDMAALCDALHISRAAGRPE